MLKRVLGLDSETTDHLEFTERQQNRLGANQKNSQQEFQGGEKNTRVVTIPTQEETPTTKAKFGRSEEHVYSEDGITKFTLQEPPIQSIKSAEVLTVRGSDTPSWVRKGTGRQYAAVANGRIALARGSERQNRSRAWKQTAEQLERRSLGRKAACLFVGRRQTCLSA